MTRITRRRSRECGTWRSQRLITRILLMYCVACERYEQATRVSPCPVCGCPRRMTSVMDLLDSIDSNNTEV